MICQECGMSVYPDNSYHPYAACLMFKGCEDGSIVTANLDVVVSKGAQYDSGFDDLADRACAAEARVKELEAECDDADFMDARIAQLEAALQGCTERGANIAVIVRDALTPAETEGDGPKCKRCNQYLCMCPEASTTDRGVERG